jgi:hypothetical protein
MNSNIPTTAYPVLIWVNKWRPVPENFPFPRCSVRTLWGLWHFGGIPVKNAVGIFEIIRIGPYRRTQ